MSVLSLRSQVLFNVFRQCSASRLLSGQIKFLDLARSVCSSFLLVNSSRSAKQLGCGRSFPALVGQISSVRYVHRIVIEDVPEDATEEMFYKHFSKFGLLLSVELLRDGRKVECHVVFEKIKAMGSALKYHPRVINNKPISIRPLEAVRVRIDYLSSSTTNESLHSYFSRFGQVFRCDIQDEGVKGFKGVVSLHLQGNKDRELASKEHVIDGQKVKVTLMDPVEFKHRVSNLSPLTTNASLTAFYSQFGCALHAEVRINKSPWKSHRYGYICFSSQQQVDGAIRSLPHIIDGCEVRLEHSTLEFILFAAQLPPNTTEERLQAYFEQFGPVYKCKVVCDKQTNQLRDFGWVIFSSRQGLNRVLADQPHSMDGKKIVVHAGDSKVGRTHSIFFSGISPTTTSNQMLYDCFSKYGSVVTVAVDHDQETGCPKESGYVTFSSMDEVSKAFLARPHVVDGKELEVVALGESKMPKEFVCSA